MDLSVEKAVSLFGDHYFNLIRRGADGSLVLSTDRWRLADGSGPVLSFQAQDEDAPELSLPLADVERIYWDRLPKQQTRSQIRFQLASGDLWSFSGSVDEGSLAELTG